METICSICGMSTATVDYDYLVGTNHLSCEISKAYNSGKQSASYIKINPKANTNPMLLAHKR